MAKEGGDQLNQLLNVIRILKKTYPKAQYYLHFRTPLELVVAAILSAQVRDEIVNAATPALFEEYKTAKDYADATLDELIRYIGKISFAGNKGRNIIEACKVIYEKYKGEVPKTLEALTELPGIGRKTALVILANAYDIVRGIVVDTHVIRVSYRLGWTKNANPEKIGADLEELIPENYWKEIPWLLKEHGRAICKAPTPICSQCSAEELCPKQGVTKSK
jgi:endonuclease-3